MGTKAVSANFHTPTKELGEVLVDLATGSGESLKGNGVESEGRVLTNVGIRRLGGL